MTVLWLTSTAAVGHQHVSVEAVALVAPVRVHAPVFARPRLQPALVQICTHRYNRLTHWRHHYNPLQDHPEVRGHSLPVHFGPWRCLHFCLGNVCVLCLKASWGCLLRGSEESPCLDKPSVPVWWFNRKLALNNYLPLAARDERHYCAQAAQQCFTISTLSYSLTTALPSQILLWLLIKAAQHKRLLFPF